MGVPPRSGVIPTATTDGGSLPTRHPHGAPTSPPSFRKGGSWRTSGPPGEAGSEKTPCRPQNVHAVTSLQTRGSDGSEIEGWDVAALVQRTIGQRSRER
jgi:hypothetical protein